MFEINEIKNKILKGDVIENLQKIPSNSIDMIFADPPYFMQTTGVLMRTEGTEFKGVDDNWDKFNDYNHYDEFCLNWLTECRRVLKKDGTIWVIGAFQNIYRIGYILQNLDFWILNDVVWSKPNPVPNFKGTRFTNSNETMIWCAKSNLSKYTFNYKTMKHLNGGKQMKSVWDIGICIGNERIKDSEGKKAHNTQKPEALLYNVIISSTKLDDIVLDPFMGSGTTGAVAKKNGRNFIGIERDEKYIKVANKRIENVEVEINDINTNSFDIKPPLVPMKELVKNNYLKVGDILYNKNKLFSATVKLDGSLNSKELNGSIHKVSAHFLNLTNNNGWDFWYVEKEGVLVPISEIRKNYILNEL
jgi:site-specific DNA-methyltransferase (adenine-specific)